MASLEFTHVPGDNRTKELPGVGTTNVNPGFRSNYWLCTLADGRRFEVRRRNVFRWSVRINQPDDGHSLGGYQQKRRLVIGGPIEFGADRYDLVTLKNSQVIIGLERNGQQIARAEASRKTAVVTFDDAAPPEPGILLFFAWIVGEYGQSGNGLVRLLA